MAAVGAAAGKVFVLAIEQVANVVQKRSRDQGIGSALAHG
jgi:hypothetical protein